MFGRPREAEHPRVHTTASQMWSVRIAGGVDRPGFFGVEEWSKSVSTIDDGVAAEVTATVLLRRSRVSPSEPRINRTARATAPTASISRGGW